jgi:beta-lactamase class A
MAGPIQKLLFAVLLLGVQAGFSASSAHAAEQDQRDLMLQAQVSNIASQTRGRVGVAAVDLDGGGAVYVNGDMPFPMASTAKVAIAATFLDGVEQGNLRLDQQFAMMVPVSQPAGARGAIAAVRPGEVLVAQDLIERSITKSDNEATDGLIAAVGGIGRVNAWLSRIGITGQRLDHTMATLVRDDGRIDPARTIDVHTSSTPRAMVSLLNAIDRGGALTPQSRAALLDTMTRTSTGRNRIRAGLPDDAILAHKTGTLADVTDDVGIVRLPDGRHLAMAIFVAGPGGHTAHAAVIAQIARTLYEGYSQPLIGANQEFVRR